MDKYSYSIIITCYNKEATIARAVESALAQGPNVEVIVVDDCSHDDSWEVLLNLPEMIRLHKIQSHTNSGALSSYLTGFRAASGQYLVMLDGDDVLLPNILNSISYSELLDTDVCLRIGMAPLELDKDYRDCDVTSVEKKITFSPGYLFAVTQNTGGTAYIFPKSIFEKSDTEWEQLIVQDHILPGVISLYCEKFIKLKTVGYKYESSSHIDKLGNQTHRKNCDRILSDLHIFNRAEILNVNPFARMLLKLAALVRARKYVKKYNIKEASLTIRLLFANNIKFDSACRRVALKIVSSE
ncbi:MAG: hypothetical protein COA53_13125 [Rhodobacteraceae bacterium]|nr:MAG: hypothetical protein COA53_13125 [Paracoccaceae bacterium]